MSQNYQNSDQITNLLTQVGFDDPFYKTEILEIIRFLNESEHFLDAFGSKSLKMLWKVHELTNFIPNEQQED